MKPKKLEIAEMLINERINLELELWANEPEKLRDYAVRYSKSTDQNIAIQPTHGTSFYTIDDYVEIARVCQLSMYVDIQPNLDNKPTPTLHMYRYC